MKHCVPFFGLLFLLVGFSPCGATEETVADLAKRLEELKLSPSFLDNSNRGLGFACKTPEQKKKELICPGTPCKKSYSDLLEKQAERRRLKAREKRLKNIAKKIHPYLKSSPK